MTAPTVSVILPTRDRSAMAEAALLSVLQQTVAAGEILVTDDGSTADHADRMRRLTALSPRIQLHRHPESRGVSAARNLGLARATGDFVLFIDDDDWIHPRFLEDALAVLTAEPATTAVHFNYRCIFSGAPSAADLRALAGTEPDATAGTRAERGNPVPLGLLESRPVSAFLRYLIPVHSCLVRRGAIGDLRFPEGLVQGEDTFFWIALAARGARFVADRRVRAYVLRHPANTTRSRSRYAREIQDCYEELLANALLVERDDAFLATLKLLWFKILTGRAGWAPHMMRVARAPDLLARELAFWSTNLVARWRPLAAARGLSE